MAVKKKPGKALYLYAIVNGKENKNYGPIGIVGKEVYTIYQGDMAAVVSQLKNQRLRPQRKHMSAHHTVLKTLMADQTPMPVAFGVIAKNQRAVQQVLADEQDVLKQAYERIRDCSEMVLGLRLDVPDIFEYFVDAYPELKSERDRLYGEKKIQPNRDDKLELGRMFDQILAAKRERLTGQIEDHLSGACEELVVNKCRDEHDIADIACLVKKGSEDQFEIRVKKMSDQYRDEYAFTLKGPWVPHSFVDLQLDI